VLCFFLHVIASNMNYSKPIGIVALLFRVLCVYSAEFMDVSPVTPVTPVVSPGEDPDVVWTKMKQVLESRYHRFVWSECSEVAQLFGYVMSQDRCSDVAMEGYSQLMCLNTPVFPERVFLCERWCAVVGFAGSITLKSDGTVKGLVVIKLVNGRDLKVDMTYPSDGVWQESLRRIERTQHPAVRALGLLTRAPDVVSEEWEYAKPSGWSMSLFQLEKDPLKKAWEVCREAERANICFTPFYKNCDGSCDQSDPQTFWKYARFNAVLSEGYNAMSWFGVLRDCRALTQQTAALSAVLDALPSDPKPSHFLRAVLSVLPFWKYRDMPLSSCWSVTMRKQRRHPSCYRVAIHDGQKVHMLIQMWSLDWVEAVVDNFVAQNTDLPHGFLSLMFRLCQHPYLQKIFPLDHSCAGSAGLYWPLHKIVIGQKKRTPDAVKAQALDLWGKVSTLKMMPAFEAGSVTIFHVDGNKILFSKSTISHYIKRVC